MVNSFMIFTLILGKNSETTSIRVNGKPPNIFANSFIVLTLILEEIVKIYVQPI